MESDSDLKFVFLDEFDRTSAEFQDAFKAFIEKYSKRGVRFIITTNHINKVSDGIKSRIPQICFDCQNPDEEKYMKMEIFKKINNVILPTEKREIPKENLISIINKQFPDFRSIMVEVESFLQTGDSNSSSTSSVSNKVKLDLYNTIYDDSTDFEKTYHFLMSNFGAEKIDTMIRLLGKPFIDWSLSEKREDINKLFECTFIISDYSSKLETNTDPIVLGMTIIGKFRELLYRKNNF
jgi:DNA polymerase III delta prime subunit